MALTEYDRKNIDFIMGGNGDWFTARLLHLCAKADASNLARLRTAFPEEVALYEAWYNQDDSNPSLPPPKCDTCGGRHLRNEPCSTVNDEYKDGWSSSERFD